MQLRGIRAGRGWWPLCQGHLGQLAEGGRRLILAGAGHWGWWLPPLTKEGMCWGQGLLNFPGVR